MTEEWRPVVGYEGRYEVSDHGRVRSLDHMGWTRNMHGPLYRIFYGKTLSIKGLDTHGYPTVCLSLSGKRKTWAVHNLVSRAFLGPKPEELEVCHWNDVKTDNRLVNLRYGTPKENQADRWRNERARKAVA